MANATTLRKAAKRCARAAKPTAVADYIAALSAARRSRAQAIRAAVHDAVSGVAETMCYRMPTFEKAGAWVAFANQKHYLAVYFCSAELIASIRAHHPELDCGVGCVRIRDTQHLPIYELREAFARALTP